MKLPKAPFTTAPIIWVCFSAFAAVSGCSSPRTVEAVHAPRPDPDAAVDQSRAFVPFEQVEPTITPPKTSAEIPPLSDRARQQIEKARGLVAEQRFTEAAIELERALRTDPNHPAIHDVLSVLHWQAGNIERAKSHATRSIEVSPARSAPHYVMGRYRTQSGETASALYEFRVAMVCEDFGEDQELAALTRFHLADLLAREGYVTAALTQYDAFEKLAGDLRSAPDRRAFSTEFEALIATLPGSVAEPKARLLALLGRYADAAEALAPIVRQRPKDAALGVQYAEILLRAGRLEDALAAARAIESNEERVISLIFDICTQAGKPEAAVAELRGRLSRRPDDSELAIRLTDVLERTGRSDDASRTLETFLADHPEAQVIRARLIQLLLKQTAWAKALRTAARAIHDDPAQVRELRELFETHARGEDAVEALVGAGAGADFAEAYLAGVTAYAAGRNSDADRLLSNAVTGNETFAPARVALARLRFDQYLYPEALELLRPDDESRPKSMESLRLLAAIYNRLDQLEPAERYYRDALQIDRTDARTMYDLAEMFFRNGQVLQAQRQLQILVQQHPDHEAGREMLAMAYWHEEKRDLAVAEFKELEKRSKHPAVLARCRIMQDPALRADGDESRKVLLEALEHGQPDASGWLAVAATYGDHEVAEQRRAFSNTLILDPDREEAMLGLARVDQLELEFESAAERLEQLLRRRPNKHDWRRRLVDLYLVVNDFDAALVHASRNIQPNEPLISERDLTANRAAYLKALTWADRSAELRETLNAWISEDSADRTWSVWLAEHYLSEKQFSQGAVIYEDLHKKDPTNPRIRQSVITSLMAAKLHDRAAQHCLGWLDDDPEDERAIGLLAAALADGGQVDAAIDFVRNRLIRTVNREPYQDWLVAQLSTHERHGDAIQLAETLLDNALQFAREMADRRDGPAEAREEDLSYYPNARADMDKLHQRIEGLRLRLVNALIAAKDYRRAVDLLSQWLDQANDPALRYRYLRFIALCYQAEGHEDKAATSMERALLLQPTDIGLSNDLAYTWIDRGLRLKDAEPLIRHAVGNAPEQGAYLDTYAWLLYKKGDFAGAERWLRRANTARSRQDPVILDHLGDALWRQGRRDEAVEFWTAAVRVVNERNERELANTDERRVKAATPDKIDAEKSGGEPGVAPLEVPIDEQEGVDRTERT